MRILRLVLLSIAIGFASTQQVLAYSNCSDGSKSCTLAIFPHTNFKQLLVTYKSLLEDLSLILDTRVKLVSARTMSDFAFKIDAKAYDIALIGAGQYISRGLAAGYIPLASRERTLGIRLYSKLGNGIHAYKDLENKRLGFMALNSTSWYAGSILLQKYNISKDDLDLVKLGSQQACAHALAINKVDACFFAVRNFEVIQQQNVNIDVKPIGETLKVNTAVYAVHPDMPKAMVDEIKSYLLSRDGYSEVNNDDFSNFRHEISLLKE